MPEPFSIPLTFPQPLILHPLSTFKTASKTTVILSPSSDTYSAQQQMHLIDKRTNVIRFGLEPLSTWAVAHPFLTLFCSASSKVGQTMIEEGVKSLLSDINTHQGMGLDSSHNFVLAKARLEHAKQLKNPTVQQEYFKAAEKLFVDAAGEVPQSYKKSEYYKYATIAAKMAGRDPQTVLDFANIALGHRTDAWKEIDPIKSALHQEEEKDKNPLRILGLSLWYGTSAPLGLARQERAWINYIEMGHNLFGYNMTTEERDTKEKLVKGFSHPSDCYSVCIKIQEQAKKAIEELAKSP